MPLKQTGKRLLARTPLINRLAHAIHRRIQVARRRSAVRRSLETDLFAVHSFDGEAYSVAHEPTIRCNLSCKMCYQANFRGDVNTMPLMNFGKELRTPDILRLYDSLKLRFIGLVGSEVFIRKDIFQLFEHLQKSGVPFTILTNGTLINEKNIENLRKHSASVRRIIYSIDGPREVHNAIRGTEEAFDQVCHAIELTRPHFNVSVNTVILQENLKHLEEVVTIVKGLGLPTLSLTFEEVYSGEEIARSKEILIKDHGWKDSEFEISTHERNEFPYSLQYLKKRLRDVRRFAESQGVFVNFTPYTWEENLDEYYYGTAHKKMQLVCPKLLEPTARIDHLGNVLFCGVLRKSWGNLLERPFEEIWNNEDFREFRKKLLDGNMLPICRRCCKVDSLPEKPFQA